MTDDKKQPIPGVTIIVKGLTVGTATDANGKYMLRLPQVENLSLLFSFVGMETKEVKYTGQDAINVAAERDRERDGRGDRGEYWLSECEPERYGGIVHDSES